MSLLKTINSPADLKRVPVEQFPALCQEIREQIISVVSNVGGHLGSNLGVVELTVALHYLLNTPNDKIVWDTSNQSYTHKLLTGRREQFHTLRQYGGLSGFCKREESEYDTFNAGHAGTGVSAAYGMVEARDQLGQHHNVGPIDGHNFDHLLPTLANVFKLKGPTFLHVITKKGLGYQPAINNPVWFHACPAFVRETGEPAKKAARPSYTKIAMDTLV